MIGMVIIGVAVAMLALGWFLGHFGEGAERVTDKLKYAFFVVFLIGVAVSIGEVLMETPPAS